MAKALNGLTKWMIIGATALIALGGYMVTVRSNTTRIDKAEVVDKNLQMDVSDLQIDMACIKTNVKYILEGIDRIERKLP